ncbi:hypothetical protein BCR33DRAFT_724496 [Rhizoclosmatium globosum]|uniref:Uncharacterized protein n=1 Tax=Rhizoclosmatium globosum TaxID=329046 RepID=A0A1Y2B637_9FUNG|nr:hypothetical protein BCR33DRAFT_724496 [Rhizoclosmatium globosum]|eukprot:ORY30156.1 hypothetical protein BCR33DRAFT_724496 [Rhizoclosmatium globosum]
MDLTLNRQSRHPTKEGVSTVARETFNTDPTETGKPAPINSSNARNTLRSIDEGTNCYGNANPDSAHSYPPSYIHTETRNRSDTANHKLVSVILRY